MGLMSKIKNILFDEEVVEVQINHDELPEKEHKEHKNITPSFSRSGIIDHSEFNTKDDEFEDDDDVIKEVVVPREVEEKTMEIPREEFTPRVRPSFDFNDDFDEKTIENVKKEHDYGLRRDYQSLLHSEVKVHHEEVKDYRKIANDNLEEKNTKKPFKVTPVISPVYGIISETKEMKDEYVTIPEVKEEVVNPNKPRKFGPVSYNDSPLPNHNVKPQVKKIEVKEEHYEVELPEKKVVEEKIEINKPIPDYEEEKYEEDPIISSPDYEDLNEFETSGVEDNYLSNDIEDAFESTQEFENINSNDLASSNDEFDSDEDVETTDEVIEDALAEDEDAHIDDTIETDLFNLIDSMYKDDDEEDSEDEE